MNKEIIHKHKIYGIAECGKNISELKPNESMTVTGVNENVTCPGCKKILRI